MATEAFVIAISTQGVREVQRDFSSIGAAGTQAGESVDRATTRMNSRLESLEGVFKVVRNAAALSMTDVRGFASAVDALVNAGALPKLQGLGTGFRVVGEAARVSQGQIRAVSTAVAAMATEATVAKDRMVAIGEAIGTIGRLGLQQNVATMQEWSQEAALVRDRMVAIGEAIGVAGRLGLQENVVTMQQWSNEAVLVKDEMTAIGEAIGVAGQLGLQQNVIRMQEWSQEAALVKDQMIAIGEAISMAGKMGLEKNVATMKEWAADSRMVTEANEAAGNSFVKLHSNVDAMTGSLRMMRNLLVTFSFFRAISDVTESISVVQQTSNMLSQVTKNTEQQSAAFDAMANAATRVHAPLAAFTQMVVAIERSSASFGKSTADVTKATQTMFSTFALSGMDESAVANVSKDMREVFNLGIVQGRQFRAIITQDQAEALLLSKYIQATGVNAAAANKQLEEMRNKGEQPSIYELSQKFKGAFTGQDVLNANIAANDEAMKNLGRTTVTMGQAFTDLHTRMGQFLNDANNATGVTGAMSQSVEFLANNIHLLAFALAAVGTILAVRYIALPIAAWFFNLGLAVASTTINIGIGFVTALGNAVIALIGLGTTATATIGETIVAAFASASAAVVAFATTMFAAWAELVVVGTALAVVVFAVWGAISGFVSAFGQLAGLGDPFKGMQITLKDLPILFDSIATTVQTQWPLVTQTMASIWSDAISAMENRLGSLGNKVTDLFQWNKGVHSFQTDRPTNTAAPGISALGKSAAMNFALGREESAIPELNGGPELQQGGLKPPSDQATPKVDKLLEATKAFAEFLKTVSPYAKEMADMEAANVAFNKASVAGVPVEKMLAEAGLNRDEINRRIARSVTGAGNATTDYTDKIRLLDVALKATNITLAEHDRLATADYIKKLTSNPQDAAAGAYAGMLTGQTHASDVNKISESAVESAVGITTAPKVAATAIDQLTTAFNRGWVGAFAYNEGVSKAELSIHGLGSAAAGEDAARLEALNKVMDQGAIATQALATVYEKFNAPAVLAEQLKDINEVVAKNPALAKSAASAMNDLNIAFLKTQTDAASGFTAGMLEVQKSMNDFAENASRVWPDLFNGFNKALSGLIDTGNIQEFKKQIHEMASSVISDLTQMMVKQTIEAPIANLLFGGGNAQAGGPLQAAATGLPASLLGSATGGLLGGGQLGASAARPMWVAIASGSGDIFSSAPSGGTTSSDVLGSSSASMPNAGGWLGSDGNSLFSNGGLFSSGGFFSNLFNGGGGLGSTSNWLLNQVGGGLQPGSGIGEIASAGGGGGVTTGGYAQMKGPVIPQGTGGAIGALGTLLTGGGAAGAGPLGFLGNLWNGTGGLGSTSNDLLNSMGLGLQTSDPANILASTTQAGGIGTALSTFAGQAGDALSSAGSWIGGLLGFAGGGDFDVGGFGGTDSQFVAFRASPDEHVSVTKPGQDGTKRNGDTHLHFNFGNGDAVDTFNRSRSQTVAVASMMADRARRRNGG